MTVIPTAKIRIIRKNLIFERIKMKSGLVFVFFGLIFLINPNFNLFDILPDFIGFALVCAGLAKYALIDENLSSAKKCSAYCAVLSVAKLVFSLWTNAGHTDYLLPLGFAFAVLEMIFMTAFFRNLCTGLDYVAMRSSEESARTKLSNLFSMSVIYTLGTRVFDFVPQLFLLAAQNEELDLSYNAYRKMPLSAVKPYVMFACVAVNLVLGLLLVIVASGALKKLRKSEKFITFAQQKYKDNVEHDRERYVSIVMPGVFVLCAIASVFLYDFEIDGVNLLPTFAAVPFFAAAFARMKKLDSNIKLPYAAYIAAAVFGIAQYVLMYAVNVGVSELYAQSGVSYGAAIGLSSSGGALLTSVICALCAAFTALSAFKTLDGLGKVCKNNRRTAALGHIAFCKVLTCTVCFVGFVSNVLRTAVLYLGNSAAVREFLLVRGNIKSEEQYLSYLSDGRVAVFQRVDSVVEIVGVVFFVIAALAVINISAVQNKSEG